jgi:hypothetical protein
LGTDVPYCKINHGENSVITLIMTSLRTRWNLCVEYIFLADEMAGRDHRWHINFMPLHSCSRTAARHVCGDPCMTTLASLQKYLFPAWMHLLSASLSRLR